MARTAPMWMQTLVSLALVAGGAALVVKGEGVWTSPPDPASADGSADEPETGVPVITAEVAEGADDVRLRAVGTGRALRAVDLRVEAAGKVRQSRIAAGRSFEAGEVLLRLEDRDQSLALALAEARLADAQRLLSRQQALRDRDTVSETAVIDAAHAVEIARLQRDRAAEAVRARVVRAPFAGTTGIPRVQVGDWVDSGTTLATLDDRSRLLVEFDVPERWLARLSVGLSVTVATPERLGRTLAGRIEAIDSRVNPDTRSAQVRVGVDNGPDLLRPGASFEVSVVLPGGTFARIPSLAFQYAREGGYVWRVVDARAEKVPATLVRRTAGGVLVEAELAHGDLVVVEGVQRLRPGRAVRGVNVGPGPLAARD